MSDSKDSRKNTTKTTTDINDSTSKQNYNTDFQNGIGSWDWSQRNLNDSTDRGEGNAMEKRNLPIEV